MDIICHNCAQTINLDTSVYWVYEGSIPCPTCKSRMAVAFRSGHLLKSEPFVKADFVEGLPGNIPSRPLQDYYEALTCLLYKAFKASAIMQRRSIQGALLSKNAPEDSPTKMIEWAKNQRFLEAKEYLLATTVTFFGNKGAHPEESEINLVSELEATQGLLVTKQLLLKLYATPGATTTWHVVKG